MKLFKDILKEKGMYSQGRVYLFVSIVAYYVTLTILTLTGLFSKRADIDLNNFTIVVEALKYAMMLFAGYVFGGKFLDVVKVLKGNPEAKPEDKKDPSAE